MDNMKHKIAILCDFPIWIANPDFPSSKGHYAIWLTPLYYAFESINDYEIHWVVLSKSVKSTLRFSSKNQFFHVIPAIKRTLALYSFYYSDRKKIKKELKLIAPDLIHTWGTESCYGLAGKDYKSSNWLHSVQGLLKAYMQRGIMPRFQRHHSLYEPSVLLSAPYITTESPWASDRVKEINPHVTPYIWEYSVEETFFSKKRNLSSRPSCLYCGNCTPIKNVETLIKAFSSKELSRVDLFLAGPTADQLPGLPPNIHALGRKNRDEVADLMSHAWALVHMSLADTGPTAVKEARVMRLPVIISEECGSKQHVQHGKSGFIVSPYDVDNLIERVLHITKSKEQSIEMGNWDSDNCREKLSRTQMINGLIKIYSTILRKTV